jgi:hypothetical protein
MLTPQSFLADKVYDADALRRYGDRYRMPPRDEAQTQAWVTTPV